MAPVNDGVERPRKRPSPARNERGYHVPPHVPVVQHVVGVKTRSAAALLRPTAVCRFAKARELAALSPILSDVQTSHPDRSTS